MNQAVASWNEGFWRSNPALVQLLGLCPLLAVTTSGAGTANNPASGAFCDDGACPLSRSCDGMGSCGDASDCVAPAGDCAPFEAHAGHAYFFCEAGSTWAAAQQSCTEVGYALVRIDDTAEQAFVASRVNDRAWIGATDSDAGGSDSEGTWRWTDGQFFFRADSGPVGGLYSNWADGEPNDRDGEDCAELVAEDGVWYDGACDLMHAYVCEGR
jgi:hypothetical protein